MSGFLRGDSDLQTEAVILAAQDDVLHTRWYQNRILRNSNLLMCRECGKAMETVTHILNMCEPKGFSLYNERHDWAILIVLWRLLKEYGFKQQEPWYKIEANPVYENRSVKILWDPSIPTDEEMTERRPISPTSLLRCQFLLTAILMEDGKRSSKSTKNWRLI